MASFPTNGHTQTAIYLSWAERGSELTRGGRGNSRKKLIEGLGRVRVWDGGGTGKGMGPAFLHPARCPAIKQPVLCLQTDIICGRLHDTVCHFHV